ncbi:hypothetical protein GCM10022408_31190 [Hymenobacter fastidiosus]|uniref:Uncharacterized protein n=1 Tax=Hymenobacter fastidiosus TaxID=486264 RepID=A0ABP7SSA7_9BACT
MTSFLLLPLIALLTGSPPAQPSRPGSLPGQSGFWRAVPPAQARRLGPPRLAPARYRVFTVDLTGLRQALATATPTSGPVLLLPLPDGRQQAFRMRTTTVLAPELAARYPSLRTYAGQATTASADYVRLEITPAGVRALLGRAGSTILIEPYRAGDTRYSICFDKNSLPAGSKQVFEVPGGPVR